MQRLVEKHEGKVELYGQMWYSTFREFLDLNLNILWFSESLNANSGIVSQNRP
jgi:hypothetical protein